VRTEITFFCGVIFRVDKNCIVRTRSHAGFAADTDRLIKVDDTVIAFEHRRGWTSRSAGSMCTLITPSYLVCSTSLRKDANIDVFDVSASD